MVVRWLFGWLVEIQCTKIQCDGEKCLSNQIDPRLILLHFPRTNFTPTKYLVTSASQSTCERQRVCPCRSLALGNWSLLAISLSLSTLWLLVHLFPKMIYKGRFGAKI